MYFILPVSTAQDSVSKCHATPQFYAVQGSLEAGSNSAIAFKWAYLNCYTIHLDDMFHSANKETFPTSFRNICVISSSIVCQGVLAVAKALFILYQL